MTVSQVIHTVFHWTGMLSAVAMVLIVPYFMLNPLSHGQNMGGAIGAALAPVIYWFLLTLIVLVSPVVAYVAARVADEPSEVRRRCWRPMLIGLATSAIFWTMFLLGLK